MAKLLVVEDEPAIRLAVRDALTYAGHAVEAVEDGESGLRRGLEGGVDAIVLDLMLPRLDGLEVCKRLREAGVRTPLVMLTARGAEPDRIAGLGAGADDYLPKPFSVRELIARVAALLRRATWARDARKLVLRTVGVEVDVDRLEVRRTAPTEGAAATPAASAPLPPTAPLTGREAAILRLFALARGRLVTKKELLREVWGWPAGADVETRTVENTVYALRRKIQEDAEGERAFILSVRGEGWKLGSSVVVEMEPQAAG